MWYWWSPAPSPTSWCCLKPNGRSPDIGRYKSLMRSWHTEDSSLFMLPEEGGPLDIAQPGMGLPTGNPLALNRIPLPTVLTAFSSYLSDFFRTPWDEEDLSGWIAADCKTICNHILFSFSDIIWIFSFSIWASFLKRSWLSTTSLWSPC